MKKTLWLVLTGCSLMIHCQENADQVWIHPDMRQILEVNPADHMTSLDLWNDQKFRLSLKDILLKPKIMTKNLVMVTFDSSLKNAFASQLKISPHTLIHYPGTSDHLGFALVEVLDQDEADRLATDAHRANNSCGTVQVVQGLPLVDPDTVPLIPPVYATAVALDEVRKQLPAVDAAMTARLAASIHRLEGLGTRFHASDSGGTVPSVIQQLLTDAGSDKISGLTFRLVTHVNTPQKSLIVTIPGTQDQQATGPVVIIGAHLDSINKTDHTAVAPGADDDASGIATLVEIVYQVAAGHLQFQRTVELHAYAAEEVGLVGSSDIASSYSASKKQVASMLQLDMDSWSAGSTSQTIYLVENDTSFTLRRYAKALLTNYLGGDYIARSLKSGTSDHRAWRNSGFATVFPFEDPSGYNEALHTPQDTSDTINNQPLTGRFVQLCLAYLMHEAGLTGVEGAYSAALAQLKSASSKDLKLAISDGVTAGEFQVSVAAAAGISSVELCLTASGGDLSCTKEMVSSVYADASGGRAFFSLPDAMALASDSHMVIYAYDPSDKMVALRTVKLSAK